VYCSQLSGKKGGTLRKKDVTFVAPDGEEVKNRRQLDKYLKAHPGTAISSDFLWSVSGWLTLTVSAVYLLYNLT
jgi:hypothetical protein